MTTADVWLAAMAGQSKDVGKPHAGPSILAIERKYFTLYRID